MNCWASVEGAEWIAVWRPLHMWVLVFMTFEDAVLGVKRVCEGFVLCDKDAILKGDVWIFYRVSHGISSYVLCSDFQHFGRYWQQYL